MCYFRISFIEGFCTHNQVVMPCSTSPVSDLQITDIMKCVLFLHLRLLGFLHNLTRSTLYSDQVFSLLYAFPSRLAIIQISQGTSEGTQIVQIPFHCLSSCLTHIHNFLCSFCILQGLSDVPSQNWNRVKFILSQSKIFLFLKAFIL